MFTYRLLPTHSLVVLIQEVIFLLHKLNEAGFEQSQNQTIELKPKNGIIKGSLTLRQPTPPSGAEICPNKNWSADLLSLIYQNVQLHIQGKNSDILTFDFGNISAISTATIQ